jgi:hypothetical protein
MIIGDTRDDGEDRGDDIGRIEPSTHPYLEDDILAGLITEIEESEQNTFLIIRKFKLRVDRHTSISKKV